MSLHLNLEITNHVGVSDISFKIMELDYLYYKHKFYCFSSPKDARLYIRISHLFLGKKEDIDKIGNIYLHILNQKNSDSRIEGIIIKPKNTWNDLKNAITSLRDIVHESLPILISLNCQPHDFSQLIDYKLDAGFGVCLTFDDISQSLYNDVIEKFFSYFDMTLSMDSIKMCYVSNNTPTLFLNFILEISLFLNCPLIINSDTSYNKMQMFQIVFSHWKSNKIQQFLNKGNPQILSLMMIYKPKLKRLITCLLQLLSTAEIVSIEGLLFFYYFWNMSNIKSLLNKEANELLMKYVFTKNTIDKNIFKKSHILNSWLELPDMDLDQLINVENITEMGLDTIPLTDFQRKLITLKCSNSYLRLISDDTQELMTSKMNQKMDLLGLIFNKSSYIVLNKQSYNIPSKDFLFIMKDNHKLDIQSYITILKNYFPNSLIAHLQNNRIGMINEDMVFYFNFTHKNTLYVHHLFLTLNRMEWYFLLMFLGYRKNIKITEQLELDQEGNKIIPTSGFFKEIGLYENIFPNIEFLHSKLYDHIMNYSENNIVSKPLITI
jgi:hypothetical protein